MSLYCQCFVRWVKKEKRPWGTWAGLHENVQANLLPTWQKVRQYRASQTDVPDWVTVSAVQPTFWDSDSFNLKCHGHQLAPNRYTFGGGSVWDVVMQPSPEHMFCVLRCFVLSVFVFNVLYCNVSVHFQISIIVIVVLADYCRYPASC